MIWLVLILVILILGCFFAARKFEIYEKRERWEYHKIQTYRITLRHSGRFVDRFDSEELGQGIVLTVIDNKLVTVSDLDGNVFDVVEFQQFTVEALFDKALWHLHVDYDPIYGFPLRLGSRWSWAVEVSNFEPNVSSGSWRHRYEDRR